jgi:hypothetical protein
MNEPYVEKVVEAIDSSSLLGAAWDCLSDGAKERFKKKIQKILDDACSTQEQVAV